MILVQREFTVPRAQRAEFERQSREGLWPAFRHYGAQMVAFGSWSFGASSEPLVTHTVYEDFDHWEATRYPDGAFLRDERVNEETKDLRATFKGRGALITNSQAAPYELFPQTTRYQPFVRSAGQDLVAMPHSFGPGSVVSERTLALERGRQEEFIRVSMETIWPWLESQGGYGMAIGHNMMGASNEITTWFAFPTMSLWYRCARPASAHAPADVVSAYTARHGLVRSQRGRILTVGTTFGAAIE
ncbi:MAG: hypothetical protein M0R73_05215 [Dehalococcoidia bacterium]|nr:hypothetical protein [Dehalococcoidia bacterium]